MIFLNKKERLLFSIVGNPLKATMVVGTSIIILLQLIGLLQHTASWFTYLKWIVPFVPPFVITRTARKINQMQAEYRFVLNAVPFIFVSFPRDLFVHALLNSPARMLSDFFDRFLADCHHNPRKRGPIPINLLRSHDYFLPVLEGLIEKYKTNGQTAAIDGIELTFGLPDKRQLNYFFIPLWRIQKIGSNGREFWQKCWMLIRKMLSPNRYFGSKSHFHVISFPV